MDIHGIVSFEVKGDIYIKCDEEGVIAGFPSQRDAVKHFEDQYNAAHGTSLTWSAGAMLHYIELSPSCHHIDDVENLVPDVVTIPFHINRIGGEFAPFWGIKCEGVKAHEWHKSGITPRLIQTA